MSPRVFLSQISPTAWEHPSETATYGTVRRRGSRWKQQSPERAQAAEKVRQWVLGDAVRVGPAQRPQLYALFLEVLQTLDWPNEGQSMPELYVSARAPMGGGGWGGVKPFVLLSARQLDQLQRDEQRFIVARGVAQLISNRMHRREAGYLFDCMDDTALAFMNVFGGGRDMKKWGGASEMSDDRGALLATQDVESALMTLLKLAGGAAHDDSLSVDAWLEQIGEAESAAAATSGVDGDTGTVVNSRAGRLARRAVELRKWAQSAEYAAILGGTYVKRGEEPVETPFEDTAGAAGSAGASGGAWFASGDMKGDAREAVNAVGEVIEKAADAVGGVVNRAADALNDAFNTPGEGIGDIANRAKDAFRDAFKAAQSAAKAAEERMDEAWRGATPDPVATDYESPAGSGAGAAGAAGADSNPGPANTHGL